MNMTSKKLLLAFGAMSIAAAPVIATVSCGSDDKSTNNSTVEIVYEKSWKPVFDKAKAAMTTEEQKLITLIEIPDGKGVDYLDTIKRDGKKAADAFPFPADRASELVTANLLSETVEADLPTGAATNKFIVANGNKLYGYPLNTESVIQIYHNDTTATGFTGAAGFASIEQAIASHDDATNPTKFIYPFGNLWHGSAMVNTALAIEASGSTAVTGTDYTSHYSTDLWVTGSAKPNYAMPKVRGTGTDFAGASDALWNNTTGVMKKMHDYYTVLRAGGTDMQTIANYVETGWNRDSKIRELFQAKTVKAIIDGPWVVNDIIARSLKAGASTAATVTPAALTTMSAAKLPTVTVGSKTGQMSHFKGGWGYGVNRLSVAGQTEVNRITKKFMNEVTSQKYAIDWFKAGGKISASGAPSSIEASLIDGLELSDPTNPNGATIKLNDYSTETKQQVARIYGAVINAVADQSQYNVQQPSGPAWAMWDAWEKQGFSKAANTSYDLLKSSMRTELTTKLAEANA